MALAEWRPPAELRARREIVAGVTCAAYGVPQPADYREVWGPVRSTSHPVPCSSCWQEIPPSSPGKVRNPRTGRMTKAGGKGTRGTHCYYEGRLRLFRCKDCQDENTRAEQSQIGLVL